MLNIVLATGNAHKAEEFGRMLAARWLPVAVQSAADFGGMPEVPEDTGTFVGNARQKAAALRERVPVTHWVMADDSGLECAALGGDPGVETANYAGPKAGDAANRAKLLAALAEENGAARAARFVCHLLLLGPDGEEAHLLGECPGRILEKEAGDGGFGYDPLFAPEGETRSFAELDAAAKDRLSHRGRAFAALAEWVAQRNL